MPLKRITITIPDKLVGAADRRAAELDRSRSWILVEALEAYLAGPPSVVHEATTHYRVGLGSQRRTQLEADLRLTPEKRVLEAQATALVSSLGRGRPRRDMVVSFERLVDFHAWERREDIGA